MSLIETNSVRVAPRERAGSLVGLTYRRLSEMLLEPEWAGGGKLPPEERLTRSLGVSRRVLREALAILRTEGRVRSRRGSGNYVEPRPTASGGQIEFNSVAIRSIADVEACLRFRCAIEVAASAAAAENRSDDDMLRLEEALIEYNHCLPGEAQFEADYNFHLLLARASGNVFFAAALEGLRSTLRMGYDFGRRMRRVSLNESQRVAAEHRLILEAIRSADAVAARAAMAAHLGAGIQRLFGKSR